MEKTISSDLEIQDHIEMDYDFSTLPPHVLANILSHLGLGDFKNASHTCKTWYYASCDPRFAKHLLLYFTTRYPELTDSLDIFVRPVNQIRFNSFNFNKFCYKKLLQNFENKITELHIQSCARLRITQLFEMLIYLPNLKVLYLEYGTQYFKPNNFYNHRRITKYKDTIRQNLSKVQELHIITTEKDLKGAEILLNYCTNLKKLYWNENCDHENLDHFLLDFLVNSKKNCLSECLESLTVHSIHRQQNSNFFESLTNLNRTNLRSLELREISETYYDVMFKEFCKTYKLLERLTMFGCNNEQLADICKYMGDLKMLNLDNTTATNFSYIGYLNNLEILIARQKNQITNESLIELFRLRPKNLTDLTLNSILTSVQLKELCENLPQLKRLTLENIETKECEPIFRHLTKLVSIHLEFMENSQINSKKIESDPEWNVTKLVELEDLYVSTFLPGFTPDLIATLPKLKTNYHQQIYDVPDCQNSEQENEVNDQNEDGVENEDDDENENDENDDGNENDENDDENEDDVENEDDAENENDENDDENENDENDDENEDDVENEEDHENEDDEGVNEDEENQPEESDENEIREYDLTEFDVFSKWFCEIDTNEILINESPANYLNTNHLSYHYILNLLTIQLWYAFKLKSWIGGALNRFREKAFEFIIHFKNRKL